MIAPDQSSTGPPEPAWPYLLLSLAFAVLPFYWTLDFDFVWDDRLLIVDNEWLLDPASAWQVFLQSFWELNQRAEHIRHFYRPLVSLSYFLQRNLQGLHAFDYHAFNLALHLANTALAFLLARRFLGAPSLALAAAVIFAVHPTRPESVVWISGRTDLMAAFFALAAMACWTVPGGPGRRALVLGALLYFLGLLCKEVAVVAPLAALLICPQGAPLRSEGGVARLASAAGVAVLIYAVLRVVALRQLVSPSSPVTLLQYTAALGWVLLHYLRLTFMLPPYHAHFAWPSFEAMQGPALAGGLALLALAVAGGAALARRRGPWACAAGVAGAFLAPALLLGRFGDVLYACRFFYLPALGVGLLFGLALDKMARALPAAWPASRGVMLASGLAGLLGLAGSVLASEPWKDDVTLFTRLSRSSPGSCYIQTNHGLALGAAKRWRDAEQAFRRALEIRPEDVPARHGLGQALREQGRIRDGLAEYHRVHQRDRWDPLFAFNTGEAYQALGDLQEAEAWYREALRRDHRCRMAAHNLGHLLLTRRRFEEAEPWLRQGLLGKDPALSHNSLGILHAEKGDLAAARSDFEAALRERPGMPEAAANLKRLASR